MLVYAQNSSHPPASLEATCFSRADAGADASAFLDCDLLLAEFLIIGRGTVETGALPECAGE